LSAALACSSSSAQPWARSDLSGLQPRRPRALSDGPAVSGCVSAARQSRPAAALARRRPHRERPAGQPHRPGRTLPARARLRRPRKRVQLAPDRPDPLHQPRRSPAVIRPRITGRRHKIARSFTPSGRWNSLRREVDWCQVGERRYTGQGLRVAGSIARVSKGTEVTIPAITTPQGSQ
jgi:hypothetical protein